MNTRIKQFLAGTVIGMCTATMAFGSSANSAAELQFSRPSLAPMLENVTPAVVNILTTQQTRRQSAPQFFDRDDLRRFFQDDEGRQPQLSPRSMVQATGSGVIVDAVEGYVITNHHVIANASTIKVATKDGREYEATLIGSDASTDVALLQIDADNLQALEFADVDNLRVGDYVLAIGNPFGVGQTVTSGIVSALGRGGLNRENYEDFIQTDAAINMGNSGGALIDLEGKLVGMNTAIISRSGSSAGIGFAVPADMIDAVIGHLERDGEVRRGQLGVLIQDLTAAMEQVLKTGAGDGALVTSVMPGSAADKAGIQASDVIVAIDGEALRNGRELRNAIGLLGVNKDIELTLYRDGRKLDVRATIGGGVNTSVASQTEAPQRDLADPAYLGATLRSIDLDSVTANTSGVDTAVQVVTVAQGSPAYMSGLREGDIIYQVNKQDVKNLRDFNKQLAASEAVTALSIVRENRQMLIIVS
ncbi:MAG: Do family serine endopeptidase [Pseudohongiellaceae bacterium]|nr:Do family serine endopeptidase [Pseudohongiellaceae bacterium]